MTSKQEILAVVQEIAAGQAEGTNQMTPRKFNHLVELTQKCVELVVSDEQFEIQPVDVCFVANLFKSATDIAYRQPVMCIKD